MNEHTVHVLEYVWRSRGGIGKHVESLCARIPGTIAVSDPATAAHFGWQGANLFRIASLCRKADLVHAHGIRAGAWASLWSRKLIVTVHTNPGSGRITRLLLRWLKHRATLLSVVSRQAQDALARQGIASQLVPNASALASELITQPLLSPAERASLAASNGWQAPVVLTIGRNSIEKNLPLAATVMQNLKQLAAGDNAVVGTSIIVGPGAGPQSQLAQGYPAVVFYDTCADVSVFLKCASVLLLTSSSEATPYVVDEALAAGVPVVATAVGDVALHVGTGGICLPVDTPQLDQRLCAAVEQVLHSPELYQRAARCAASALPTISDVARFWCAKYSELAGKSQSKKAQ